MSTVTGAQSTTFRSVGGRVHCDLAGLASLHADFTGFIGQVAGPASKETEALIRPRYQGGEARCPNQWINREGAGRGSGWSWGCFLIPLLVLAVWGPLGALYDRLAPSDMPTDSPFKEVYHACRDCGLSPVLAGPCRSFPSAG